MPPEVNEPDTMEEQCLKYFPKPFRRESGSNEGDYYISYRRRSPQDGGETARRKCAVGNGRFAEKTVDNSWVVAHCTKLIMMFDCHINVELCISRVGSIKYLFKYLCKGRDRVTVELTSDDPNQRHDELQNFIDARYASESEAIWRLLGLTYIKMSPTVAGLDVHLPGHQNVYFETGQEREAAGRTNNRTKLFQFFEVNRQ